MLILYEPVLYFFTPPCCPRRPITLPIPHTQLPSDYRVLARDSQCSTVLLIQQASHTFLDTRHLCISEIILEREQITLFPLFSFGRRGCDRREPDQYTLYTKYLLKLSAICFSTPSAPFLSSALTEIYTFSFGSVPLGLTTAEQLSSSRYFSTSDFGKPSSPLE